MTDIQTKSIEPNKKAREGRSPGFPIIDLKKALQRAEEFRIAEGKHSAPVAAARKAWNLGDGVLAKRTVAALGYFGLFDDEGAGEQRKVRLTDAALKILLDKQPISPEREDLIRGVALKPVLHKELWDKWGHELPSDVTIETYLVRDRGFSSTGAEDLISEYKTTLAFAKLGQSAIMVDNDSKDREEENPPPLDIAVGDLVQVEINGAFTLPKAARVRAVHEDQGQIWIFVEGSKTGILMEQVVLQSKGLGQPSITPPELPEDKPPPKPGMNEEKNSLDEGEAVLIWPENLSPDSVRDLEYWLQGVLKKAKRRAGINVPETRLKLQTVIKANMIATGSPPERITDENISKIIDAME